LEGVGPPGDALAEQKVALVRLFLYLPGTLWVTPTVEREFLRIRRPEWKAKHQSWASVHFGVRPPGNTESVARRAAELKKVHPDEDDCLVLAEAEDIGIATLLSFDDDFLKRLAPHARLALTRPAEFWATLGIPEGATPHWLPTQDNPLAHQTWWRW
jgi:predicted nucleic acid-binding protein